MKASRQQARAAARANAYWAPGGGGEAVMNRPSKNGWCHRRRVHPIRTSHKLDGEKLRRIRALRGVGKKRPPQTPARAA